MVQPRGRRETHFFGYGIGPALTCRVDRRRTPNLGIATAKMLKTAEKELTKLKERERLTAIQPADQGASAEARSAGAEARGADARRRGGAARGAEARREARRQTTKAAQAAHPRVGGAGVGGGAGG